MRILQLSSARHFGGGERHFIDLTNALAQRGHEMFVGVVPGSPLVPELSNVPPHRMLELSFRSQLLTNAITIRQLVRRNKIDIVHAHIGRDYPLAILAAGRSAAKVVLTRHVLFPLGQIHRLARRRVARVIAVSEAAASQLRSQRIFDDDQITAVVHGIDLNRFDAAIEFKRSGTVRRVGMLGEISAVKGQDDFVRAAAIIAGRHDDVEFVIVGRDHSDTGSRRAELEHLIKEAGLGNRLTLVETVDDVPRFLSSLDIFVSASRSEAFGLAIVEAMAAGAAVIATMTDGAREIIEADRTARLVPIGDIMQMAKAIDELLSQDELRNQLSANAKRMVAERFSLARMVDDTEQVYREVLNTD